METPVTGPVEMGKSIVDVGFLVMAAACYLVYSAIIIFVFVKWFVRTLDGITMRYRQTLDKILQLVKEIHRMIKAKYDKP